MNPNDELRQYMRWEGVDAARFGGERLAPTPLMEEARRAFAAMRARARKLPVSAGNFRAK